MDAVQVVNAEYSSMSDDFDEVESKGDTTNPDETPESVIFGEQEATVSASQDFDDEIPF